MLKIFVIGTLILTILIGEYNFAMWLQSLIDGAIPKGEWYSFVRITTIVLHIVLLGSTYIAVALWSSFAIVKLLNLND